MIDLLNLSVQFGGVYLFENVSFRINPGDKISLVGANGTGKSTLLKILIGKEEPEAGLVQKPKNLKIGYLPQEFIELKGSLLFDEVRSSIPLIEEIESKDLSLHTQLESAKNEDEKEKILLEIGNLNHKKEDIDYYSINSKIEKTLIGLGFKETDFDRSVSEFSGGWQMRIQLAKILLADNELLLLDEPTNHLDIDSLQWLIEFLKNYSGAILLVSHDKYFVNQITNRTLEIYNRKVTYFTGNYDAYLKFKKERDEQLKAEFENQQRKLRDTQRFIERFRYKATKAKQVQSRIKQLEKVELVEIPDSESEINIRFPAPPRSGSVPVKIENLAKSYDSKFVFDNLNLELERGDKIAFVGPNGAGKTTLAKIIAQRLKPTSGSIIYGHNTFVSYYAQEVAEDLNLEKDIIDSVSEVSPDTTVGQLRTILGSFLFSDDDVFKKVQVLSGGEKSRVALAKILLTKANLIVLDEPTNHLDITSKGILQRALINFDGTLILVSHDVDFMHPIVNKVFEIKDNHKQLYYGGIDYYFAKKDELQDVKVDQIKKQSNDESIKNRKNQKRIEAELRQKKYAETKELKSKLEDIESEIGRFETLKEELENSLADSKVYSNPALAKETKLEYESASQKLERLYDQWTEITEKIEEVEKRFGDLNA